MSGDAPLLPDSSSSRSPSDPPTGDRTIPVPRRRPDLAGTGQSGQVEPVKGLESERAHEAGSYRRGQDETGGETQLVGLVREALDQMEAGQSVDPEVICAEFPQLAPALAEALGLSGELGRMQAVARDVDPLAGSLFGGRYQLDERLGLGAMGVVYRATDLELQRAVAVKILEQRVFQSPTAEQRFLREAEHLARLQHHNVVAVFDRGRSEDGQLFLVMELLDGAPLSLLLPDPSDDGAPRSEQDLNDALRTVLGEGSVLPEHGRLRCAARWAADVARGLAAAHAVEVVHRDVKPSNIVVRKDGSAVLLDFGIAARPGDPKLTIAESAIGTPWYMPPEYSQGGGEPTARGDLYSLAASLYHLLSGQPPYDGDVVEVLSRQRFEDPAPIAKLCHGLPRDLRAIIECGMARDPAARYPSAQAMADDLNAFLAHRPVVARPLGWMGRRWSAIRLRPWRAVAGVAAAAALALVAVVIPLWRAQAANAVEREVSAIKRQLPSLLAIEGSPDQRLLGSREAERAELLGLFDRLIELEPDDLPNRLWRAALLLDAGRVDAAAKDLGSVAGSEQSEYLREVAVRYRQAADQGGSLRGIERISFADLGVEPKSAQEQFVAGFHALRARHVASNVPLANQLLETAAADGYLPARDLQLLSLLALGDAVTSRSHQVRIFQQAYDAAVRLEGDYGHQTARTCATRGAALIVLRRYEEAIEPLKRSLELRPGRHGPLHNLGVAYRRIDLEKSMEYLGRAAAIRPEFWNTTYTKAQVLLARNEFDQALELVGSLPEDGPSGLGWKRASLIGDIELQRAIDLLATAEGAADEAEEPPVGVARSGGAGAGRGSCPRAAHQSAPALQSADRQRGREWRVARCDLRVAAVVAAPAGQPIPDRPLCRPAPVGWGVRG